jgi:hypothetical protein
MSPGLELPPHTLVQAKSPVGSPPMHAMESGLEVPCPALRAAAPEHPEIFWNLEKPQSHPAFFIPNPVHSEIPMLQSGVQSQTSGYRTCAHRTDCVQVYSVSNGIDGC